MKLESKNFLFEITEQLGLSISDIKRLNKDKKLEKGEWVFIPLNRGLLLQEIKNPMFNFKKSFLWPVPATAKISSGFGRRWGRAHEGIDIPAVTGTHFLAAEDGVVKYAGNKLSSYGNMVVIAHDDDLFTVYAHAHRLFVKTGDTVSRAQVIGQVGSTGRSTGPHLHFEIRKKKKAINPTKLLVRK